MVLAHNVRINLGCNMQTFKQLSIQYQIIMDAFAVIGVNCPTIGDLVVQEVLYLVHICMPVTKTRCRFQP